MCIRILEKVLITSEEIIGLLHAFSIIINK